jgi:lactate dehydrogenase-like 2-hydroxyacid dehydrogenase
MSTADRVSPMVLALPTTGMHEALSEAGYTVVPWPQDEAAHRRLLELAPEIQAVTTVGPRALPEGFLEAASRLGLICCLGAGFENYDPMALKARGVRLVNCAGLNADDVAELGFGLYIAAVRRIVAADGWVRAGLWRQQGMARRIRGQRLGVFGLGAIGNAMAVRGEAFGMEVGWCGPNPKPVSWSRFEHPMELARWADVLAICARPTPENEGLVDEAMLNALGPRGVLVNLARGSLVDEQALISALKGGRIAAAALDVFAQEPPDPRQWEGVPNLTLHPHSGGATHESVADGRDHIIENLRRYFAGQPLIDPIN